MPAEQTNEVPKNSREYVKLTRAAGYVNPWDVWKQHPSKPCWVYWRSWRGEDLRYRQGWRVALGVDDPAYAEAARKREEEHRKNPWKQRETMGDQRLGRAFDTFEEALAWAEQRCGIKAFEYVKVNGMGGWFGSQNLAWRDMRPCTVSMENGICERPVVGVGRAGWGRGERAICKMHLGHAKRRDAREAEAVERARVRDEADAEDRRKRQVAEDQAALLRGKGFRVAVARSQGGWEPVLNGEVLLALVDRFELACREMDVPFADEVEDLTKGGRA